MPVGTTDLDVTPARGYAGEPASLFPKLEPLLPSVQKPIQYVGGELNSTHKPWDDDLAPSAGR